MHTPESTLLADEAVDGVYPSDHTAVVCELRWSAGTEGRLYEKVGYRATRP
jgi:hypothetical protein